MIEALYSLSHTKKKKENKIKMKYLKTSAYSKDKQNPHIKLCRSLKANTKFGNNCRKKKRTTRTLVRREITILATIEQT
jgi:hypothetical protein